MKKIVITIIILTVFIVGCKKPNETCEEEKTTAAFIFEYEDTVTVGEAFNLTVNYVIENSCGDFGRFEVVKSNHALEIQLKTAYKGCDCANQFEEKLVNFPIILDEAGAYELKFWVEDEKYETYVVVAEE